MYDNEQLLFEALEVAASGYALNSGAGEDIVTAGRRAMRGRRLFMGFRPEVRRPN
jgi:DNA-binding NarL/FixJ family response regulator